MRAINSIESTYRRLTAEGRSVVKLFSGNPNDQGFLFPLKILEEAYHSYFRRQTYHPHPKGLPEARRAIHDYYRRRGAAVDSEDIILTSGTSESFLYLFSLLARPGDNILIPNPSYPLFEAIAKMVHVELLPYPLVEEKGWAIDLEELQRRADDRTKGVILISPNNPTGAVVSRDEIVTITAWADSKGIPLICDEVFSEFWFGEGEFPRVVREASPSLCFTLNGISKMFALPSLKLGWIAVTGRSPLVTPAVDRLETTADTFLSCHTPIQEALPVLFESGEQFVREYREEVGRRRRLAIALLKKSPSVQVIEPRGGFYLMGKVVSKIPFSEEEFVIRLMEEKGVFVHPGYFYDYEDGIHFIISFLTKPEELKRGLEALLSFINSFDR